MSPTTRDLLIYYCMRANQVNGQTNVSAQRASQDLDIRKDHVDEHDRKLARMGLIEIQKDENGGRIVQLCAPWQSSEHRKRKPLQIVEKPASSQDLGESTQDLGSDSQNLGSPLNESPKFGGITQDLGGPSQNLGEVTQNLGKSSQNLGAHIRNNQPMNQPMEPEIHVEPPTSPPPKAKRPRQSFSASPDVMEVFNHWRTAMNHPTAALSDKRRQRIKDRLAEGYSVETLKRAIDGCKLSPWHMGTDPKSSGQVFDDIELICRSAEKVDMHVARLGRPNGTNGANGASRPVSSLQAKNETAFQEAYEMLFGEQQQPVGFIDAEVIQ